MIDLAQARQLLGDDAPASDAEVLALRDLVSSLAELLLDSLQSEPSGSDVEAN